MGKDLLGAPDRAVAQTNVGFLGWGRVETEFISVVNKSPGGLGARAGAGAGAGAGARARGGADDDDDDDEDEDDDG